MVPISLVVWPNNKGIAAVNGKGLKAMEHDFHNANIIPSAILGCNIPKSMGGLFFIGDEDGYGQIFFTLEDDSFGPSKVFDHCAQLIGAIRKA